MRTKSDNVYYVRQTPAYQKMKDKVGALINQALTDQKLNVRIDWETDDDYTRLIDILSYYHYSPVDWTQNKEDKYLILNLL